MSAIDDRIKDLEERVKSLESKFTFAVTLAVFLGISVAGIGAWVKSEAKEVSDLQDQIKDLAPFVTDAKTQLQKAANDQVAIIQTKAEPIVTQLTQATS
jgi:hypothetical protein